MRPIVTIALSLMATLLVGGCDRPSGPENRNEAADSATVSGLIIRESWARETVEGAPTGAVYFTIRNDGGEPDSLLSAETEVAERAEIHGHVHEGDMMRMRRLETLEIAPGDSVALSPGGNHLMLFGLKRSLHPGDRFMLVLDFANAGQIEVPVEVRSMAESSN